MAKVQLSGGIQGLIGNYNYAGGEYTLEYKLVLKKAGLYYLEQAVAPELSPDQTFENKCSNTGIGAEVNMNNGNENNIDLLSESPDPHFNEWILANPADRFYKFGGFCFKVAE